jgi:hypothetical protein
MNPNNPCKIYQDDVDSFMLDLHDFIGRHPLIHTETGFDYLKDYVEKEFDKRWPHIFTGYYNNYN